MIVLRATEDVQLLAATDPLLHRQLPPQSTVRYLGVEVNDALEIAEQTDV